MRNLYYSDPDLLWRDNLTDHASYSVTERQLLDIWREVLDCDNCSLDQDFMDLGGDSLAAVMCISRVRRLFDCEFTIEDLFSGSATIRLLAAQIDQGNDAEGTPT